MMNGTKLVQKLAAGCLTAAIVTGCSTPQYVADGSVARVADLTAARVPGDASLFSREVPFRLGPRDTVKIDVQGLTGFLDEVQVDTGGRISVPIVGSVLAAGKTPAELSEEIRRGLTAGFVRNPVVSVNVTEIESQTVTVEGEVGLPGIYPLASDMTLLRAIASARGINERGRTTEVFVLRMIDGQRYAALYNLAAIRQGAYADPRLFANDIVVVNEDRARQLFRDLITVAPSLVSPLIILLQN